MIAVAQGEVGEMGRLRGITERRRGRTVVTGLGLLLLLATVGGIGWTANLITRQKAVRVAASYHILVPRGHTDSIDAHWEVGQATVGAGCGSERVDTEDIDGNPSNGLQPAHGWSWGLGAPGVHNNGPGRIAVMPIGGEAYPGTAGDAVWLDPGEDADILGGNFAQSAWVPDGTTPDPDNLFANMTSPFAILAEDGASSATGLFAFSSWVDADLTGHCVFSLQMAG